MTVNEMILHCYTHQKQQKSYKGDITQSILRECQRAA